MLGYKTTQREFSSDQGIELKVFQKITSALKSVDETAPGGATKLAEALIDNAKLWNVLFIDLVNPDNTLPHDLKTSLISLAEFSQTHTRRALLGQAEHQVLIDINEAMIAGLRERAKTMSQVPSSVQSHNIQTEAA